MFWGDMPNQNGVGVLTRWADAAGTRPDHARCWQLQPPLTGAAPHCT